MIGIRRSITDTRAWTSRTNGNQPAMGGSLLLGPSPAAVRSHDISIYRPAYPISMSYDIDFQSARVLRAGFAIFVQKSLFRAKPPRGHGHAGPRGVAYIVVKDENAAGAQLVAHQALDLRVVDALDLLGRIEVGDRGRRLDQGEAVAVERELGFTAARVLNLDIVRVVDAVPARNARRRLDTVRGRLFGAAFQVMERRGQGCRGYSDIERHDWTPPMLSLLCGGLQPWRVTIWS